MCDNFAAVPNHTQDRSVILGKNSDREPNEAQALVRLPRRLPEESELQTTYITVPQVRETYEVVLSKPFQMWGAEMGVNEHGLAIGNEALFTVVPIAKQDSGLTGMDMLRLALERCRSAEQAIGTITELVERYGQDACGGYQDKSFYYFNSFAVADPERAYVLETIDRHWAFKRIDSFHSISNGLSLGEDFDQTSAGIEDFALRAAKHRRGRSLNIRTSFSDFLYTTFSGSSARRRETMRLGQACRGRLDARAAMAILRSHGTGVDEASFDPAGANNGAVCMHAAGPITRSQTTGSLVAVLRPDGGSTFWFTGSAAPCLSVFKPLVLPGNSALRGNFPEPGPRPDDSLWWRHERFHRFVLGNYRDRAPHFVPRLRGLEGELLAEEAALRERGADTATLDAFSQRAFERSDALLAAFYEEMLSGQWKSRSWTRPVYSFVRRAADRAVGLEPVRGSRP